MATIPSQFPRALHFVFKVADRTKTIRFYKDVLGMKVLRHEEFEEGCKAACNGPYDGRWSKTMIGYGAEDSHFVLELTYNYGIKSYSRGNDFQRVVVHSRDVVSRARGSEWPQETAADGALVLEAPGGYPFHLYDQDSVAAGPVFAVTLSVSQLTRSLEFWGKVLGMSVYEQGEGAAVLGYGDKQARLELSCVDAVDHAEAFGRIAFSCPSAQLPGIEERAGQSEGSVLTPLVSLDTPGKATVQVVILASPDGHEICFVGEEAFSQLSQVDPAADQLLSDAIAADKSDEWFAKRNNKQ